MNNNPIGFLDSGIGGVTVLREAVKLLPNENYFFFSDSAHNPYGDKTDEEIIARCDEIVSLMLQKNCKAVVLACNTASAKALRTIQQVDLPKLDPSRRVLGIIRPTAEVIGQLTTSRHVGILATEGTIRSDSYRLEIQKLYPDIVVSGVACPFWVPLVEYNEADSPGADYFVKKRIDQLMRLDPSIDAVILGCTHYPLLMPKIVKYVSPGVRIIPQGEYVAESLQNYFQRHPEMETRCSKGGRVEYLTTENPDKFRESAQIFLHEHVDVRNITLG